MKIKTKYYEKVLPISKREGRQRKEIKAHCDFGNVYEQNNESKKEIECINNTLKIENEELNKEEKNEAYHPTYNDASYIRDAQWNSYLQKDSRWQNEDLIEKMSTHGADKKWTTIIGEPNNTKASDTSDTTANMDNTEENFHDKRACTVVDETSLTRDEKKMMMIAYLKRGLSLLLIGQHKESTICYHEVAKLASEIEDKEAEMKAYAGLGRAFSNTGDFESSQKFFLKALAVAKQHNDNNVVKEACIMLGNVYYTAGKFENALESYLEAQKISVELGARKDKTLVEFQHLGISFVVVERKDEANICFMLGNTFQQLKREEKAIESYQRAMDISNELKDNEMQVLAEQRLGEMSPHNFPTDQESELVTETKQEQIQEMESWFEKTFLDSKQQLKDEIDEELESFPWFGGSYGLAAPNKKIPRLHLFLTVKRGTKKVDVRCDLEKKYERDPKKYFELLLEPKRKPKIKFLGNGVNEASPQASAPSSDLPSPGGSVLACIPGSPNPCHLPEKDDKNDSHEIKGRGTLTLFCFLKGHHFAITCFHVGCANDEMCLNATFNKVENIWKIRSSLTNYKFLAKERTYRFRKDDVNNNDDHEAITFEPDDGSHSPLGDFHDFRFDHNCDILSLKISNDVEVDCKIEDATSREWKSIWDELLGKFKERTGPIEVGKHQLSSSLTDGHIVSCDAKVPSYGKNKNIFRHAIVVKGCNGPFLKDGDSGSLVFFRSKNKQPFAYGVCKVDDHLVLPGHQTCSVDSDSDSDSDTSSIWSEDDSSNRTGSMSESEEVPTETEFENASTVESVDDSDNFKVEFRAEANCVQDTETTETYFICLRLDTALENLGLHEAACVGSCGRTRKIESHE